MEDTPDQPAHGKRAKRTGPKCGAPTKSGKPCRKPAGAGTDHLGIGTCEFHLGNSPSHVKAAEKIKLERLADEFGVSRNVDPADAVHEALHKAAGRLDFYEAEVGKLDSPWVHSFGQNGETISEHPAVSAADRSLVALFTMAEKILKLGLAERQVMVGELQAALLARAVTALLDAPELGLSREQRETGRQLAGRQLRELVKGNQ